jgi:hypothetical protein
MTRNPRGVSMLLKNSQRAIRPTTMRWRCAWLGLALLLASWPAAALSQQPFVADPYQGSPEDGPQPLLFESISGRSGQAFGSVLRGGFVTGPGVGRDDSFAPIELMPYFFLEDTMVYGDIRGFRSVEDHYGFNSGFGFRHYLRKSDRIIGANFYYDYDNTTRGRLFRQVGGGLEFLGANWDMRLNTYFPVTQNTQEIDLSDPFNIRFAGNNILFDQIRTFGVHQKGLDHELGVPLPGRYPERHNVRAVAGWYHFQQTGSENTWGWKSRLEGDLTANVHMGLEVTHDNTFDTNVVLSVAMSYGGFKEPEGQRRTQFSRMTDHVHRQYTAVVAQVPVLEAGLPALDTDGTPLLVEHVASSDPYDRTNLALMRRLVPQFDPTATLGTFENPFITIPESQADPQAVSDITVVWANSVYTGGTTLSTEAGNRLLGESDNVGFDPNIPGSLASTPHTFLINGAQQLLPRAIDTPAFDTKPLFNGIGGNGLLLTEFNTNADRVTEFSGFRFGLEGDSDPNTAPPVASGPTLNGILATAGANNVILNNNDINFAGLDGIRLEDVGRFNMTGNRIFNAANNGLHIISGTPQITFVQDGRTSIAARSEIENDNQVVPNGYAVYLEGIQEGARIDMSGALGARPSRINYLGAGAIRVDDGVNPPDPALPTGGVVLFGQVTNRFSPVDVITIVGSGAEDTGSYNFRQTIDITGTPFVAVGDAINIEQQEGNVRFEGIINITDRQGHGIDLLANAANVTFAEAVEIDEDFGVITVTPAIEYQQSSGNVTFQRDVELEGGFGEAILIGQDLPNDPTLATNNTGTFRMAGDELEIDRFEGINISLLEDDAVVRFDTEVNIDDRGGPGIVVDRMRSPVSFTQETNVNNRLPRPISSETVPVSVLGTNFQAAGSVLRETEGVVSFNVLNINDGVAPALLPDALRVNGLLVLDVQAPVFVNELNVDTTIDDNDGTALSIVNAGDPYDSANVNGNLGRVELRSGTITIDDARAINVEDSRINLALETVSSENSPLEGIRMVNNSSGLGVGRSTLEVGLLSNDGGTIEDALFQGALFSNTGNIRLNLMTFDNNGLTGITANNVPLDVTRANTGLAVSIGRFGDRIFTDSIELTQLVLTDNSLEGLLTVDIPDISLIDTEAEGNDLADEIRLLYIEELIDRGTDLNDTNDDTELFYNISLVDVIATEDGVVVGGNNAITIDGQTFTSRTPNINLFMFGSTFDEAILTLTEDLSTVGQALAVLVDGTLTAQISGYQFINERNGDLDNATDAVLINQESDEDTVDLLIFNNVFNLSAGTNNAFSLFIEAEGPSDIVVNDNLFFHETGTFATTAIGMVLDDRSNVVINGTADNTYPLAFNVEGLENLQSPPLGNIIVLNGGNSIGINLEFDSESSLVIENNGIGDTQVGGFGALGNQGIIIDAGPGLALSGGLNNIIALDIFNFDPFSPILFFNDVLGTGAPWFQANGNINGSIIVNGSPQP